MFFFSWTSLFLKYSFNEVHRTSGGGLVNSNFFLFFLGFCAAWILEFGFLSYPKLCSWFFDEQKATPYASSSFHDYMATIIRLHPVMNKWQLTKFPSFKNSPHVCFGVFHVFHWSKVCFSADTYMSNRE